MDVPPLRKIGYLSLRYITVFVCIVKALLCRPLILGLYGVIEDHECACCKASPSANSPIRNDKQKLC